MKGKYFTIDELAERWKLTPETIRRMVRDSKLKSIKFGNRVRITEEEITCFEDQNES